MKAKHLQTAHLVLTVGWALMVPVALATGWIYSIMFISIVSIYANFVGHFSSWQASRTEVKQDAVKDRQDHLQEDHLQEAEGT